MQKLLFYLLLLCVFTAPHVRADERILSYHSTITVQMDGWLEVAEEITVRAEGREIQRGIYRDFPRLYKTPLGLRQIREFEVREVTRNGEPEPWTENRRGSQMKLRIGDRDVLLPQGSVQVYRIVYRTSKQLILEEDGDELYWNVTGNGWAFPMDEVRATVRLPQGAKAFHREAYVGVSGARDADYELEYHEKDAGGPVAEFRTTRPLLAWEGLTIALRWQPGLPDAVAYQKDPWWRDNEYLLMGLAFTVAGFFWILRIWRRSGGWRRRGLAVPR